MKITPYLVTCRHKSTPNQVLLFATKTGASIILSEEDFTALKEGKIPKEHVEPLTEMGYLVDSVVEERQNVHGYFDEINRVNPNLTVAVVLGMECNFACNYCFEGKLKGRHAMSDETANQLVAYLKKRFTTDKKTLKLEIYGGEPLLYKKSIIYLAQRLKPFMEEQGAELKIELISNGSLLTEKVVEELNQWGLDGVKVTLDGPPENHNRFRPFKSGAPSFEVIVDNLAKVCAKTNIRLGGNYTMNNYQTFPSVLDYLAEQGITPDKLERVSFNIVTQVKDKVANNEYMGGCCTINEPWVRNAALHIREEVFKRGYNIPEITPSPCAVEVDDAVTVYYDGSLYKCITLMGHEQYKIGDIWQGINEKYKIKYCVEHWKKEEKCKTCKYLPLCFGGCRYMAFQRDGHMEKVDCWKPFLDASLEKMLLQDLKYRYGQD